MNRRAFLSSLAALPLAYLPFLKREPTHIGVMPKTLWVPEEDVEVAERIINGTGLLADAVNESQEAMAKSIFNDGFTNPRQIGPTKTWNRKTGKIEKYEWPDGTVELVKDDVVLTYRMPV